MSKREKVIKGLECCILLDPDDKMRCSECPYNGSNAYCLNRLKMDALDLVDTKPRVMTVDELRKTFYLEYYLPDSEDGSIPGGFFIERCSDYWEEHKVINIGRRKQTITYCIFKIDNEDPEDEMYFLKSEENKRWRCWTFKPTEEEREAEAWQQQA